MMEGAELQVIVSYSRMGEGGWGGGSFKDLLTG